MDGDEPERLNADAAKPRAGLARLPQPRLLLALVIGVVALLCLAGTSVAYVIYDRTTRIDRSNPEAVVDDYVHAVLGERDDARAALFVCHKPGELGLGGLRQDLLAREARFGIRIIVSTANYQVTTHRSTSHVDADLRIDVPEEDGRLSRSTQHWQFGLRQESGWRVCSATRAS